MPRHFYTLHRRNRFGVSEEFWNGKEWTRHGKPERFNLERMRDKLDEFLRADDICVSYFSKRVDIWGSREVTR